jgi:pimeloyl-ACP methyl ester carboxylesterase
VIAAGAETTAGRPRRFAGSGGVSLAADIWGPDTAPPLILLHGGGQTRGSWGAAGARLSGLGWRVVAPDARGHGESDWSPDGEYDLDRFADDVRALTSAFAERPVLVGASLGGLSSLLAVGEAPPAAARALVLVDVAHRPNAAGARRILDFMAARPDGFSSLHEAGDAVETYLPHRKRPNAVEGLRRNLRRRGDRWVWHWDPRLLDGVTDRIDPTGAPERHLDAARAAGLPILLVRGGISDVVTEPIAAEFCEVVPGAESVVVPGTGHMVAGDSNERFIEAMLPFLDGIRESG